MYTALLQGLLAVGAASGQLSLSANCEFYCRTIVIVVNFLCSTIVIVYNSFVVIAIVIILLLL